jgi:hypothetical protein
MTALAVIGALLAALWVGYQCGRRASPSPFTWRKQTSRTALGRLAITLVVFMAARRLRRHAVVAGALRVIDSRHTARRPRKPMAGGGVAWYRRSVT